MEDQEFQAIVKRVDHLAVRVNTPEPLFSALTQQLLLPAAWPVRTNPFYTSGGIHLGNLNLELIQVGQKSSRPARLYGIAFELEPYELSLPELSLRGIPHTPPMPFYVVDEAGWQITAWTSVFLGGLLPGSGGSKMFFSLSHRLPKERWEEGSLPTAFNRRRRLPFVYDRVYPVAMTYGINYNKTWRAANMVEEPNHTGLDVQRVYEVTVGTRRYPQAHACWKALLDPHPEIAPGVWELPDGLHLRLIEAGQDGLRRMVWQVTSLNRAVQFLFKHELLGEEKDGMQTICADKFGGLDIRLVQ